MRKNQIRETRADRIFNAAVFLIVTLFFLVVAYPMYFILIASFSDPNKVAMGNVLLYPKGITLRAYETVFNYPRIWQSYANTLFYTIVGTAWNLFLTIPAAYALSKKKMRGRGFLLFMVTFTMYFSGGMIPNYLLVKNLGLLNSWWILIIISGVNTSNLIIAKTFFSSSVPVELEEAANIDGCSQIGTFVKIVIPISKSMMGVLLLYYMIVHWNDYSRALIYINSAQEKWPLALVLRQILVLSQVAKELNLSAESIEEAEELTNLLKYALIIVASMPMMVLYPTLQKCFEKGLMIGSIKG